MKTFKDYFIVLIAFIIPIFIFWCSGRNLERSEAMAGTVLISLFSAFFTALFIKLNKIKS